MKAIILAAGRGSRMGGLTDDRPKCLVTLAGRPLLDRQRAALTSAGITRIGLVRGYHGELFEGRGLELFDNPRWHETNMVMSLACARDWLRTEPVIVSYSDIFYDPAPVRALIDCQADLAITYDPAWLSLWSRRFADPLADAETFQIDDAGRILEIGQRPATVAEVQGQYMGLLKLTPRSWAAVEAILDGLEPAARDRLDMTSLLRLMIASPVPPLGVPIDTPWGEVDNASDLALYEADFPGN